LSLTHIITVNYYVTQHDTSYLLEKKKNWNQIKSFSINWGLNRRTDVKETKLNKKKKLGGNYTILLKALPEKFEFHPSSWNGRLTEAETPLCKTMASSNTPKPHKSPKAKKGEISTTQNKTKEKTRDITKEENQKKKNKKPKLSNGNSKHPHQKGAERSGEDEKANVFPMNRIRTMIKGEDPDMRVSQEAVLAINKAVVIFYFAFFSVYVCMFACLASFSLVLFPLQEKFLEQFTQDAYACCVQDRKKCLSYKHVGKVLWLRYVSSVKFEMAFCRMCAFWFMDFPISTALWMEILLSQRFTFFGSKCEG